jgi:hypothetical protein
MMKHFRTAILISSILFSRLNLVAQAIPCRPGTMANVLGTSCSVGPVVFNFQTDFLAASGVPFTAADIGFIPVQSGDQVGFKLVLNFVDGPGTDSSFASHLIQFSYTPQAAPGSEIRVQGLSMDAHVQGAPLNSAFVQILDFQTYPNSGFLDTDVALDNEQGTSIFNQPINNVILEVPGLLSTGSGFPGTATTQIFDFSTGHAAASLTSATFLYTTGPIIPAPGLASLQYSTIDLPGVATTFVSNIINSGRTVGSFQDFAGNFHGYVAEPRGGFTTVDVPGATDTFGGGLNERGDVVGSFNDADGNSHGFVRRDGVFTSFDVPGSIFTAAVAINNKGQIAGEYESADRGFHAFLLDDGVFTTIDHGPGTGLFASTGAFALNNAGEIAGFFFDPNTFRGFSQKKGSFLPVDVPGQGDTTIEGINDPGDAVGIYNDFNLIQHGFVLSREAFQTVDFPDGSNTFALGINASGKIVGIYQGADGNTHSFLATPANGDGQDHRPKTSDGKQAAAPKLDCRDEQWQRGHGQRRNTGGCQVKQ